MKHKKIFILFIFSILSSLFALTFYLFAQPKSYTSAFKYSTVNWQEKAQDPKIIKRGEMQFKIRCYTCHGFSGQGSATAPALNDSEYLHGNSYEDILKIVRFGSSNSRMMGWEKKLQPEDIIALTVHVHNL